MGKKRQLPLVQVGEGPSCSRQRGENECEAVSSAEQATTAASDARTQPAGRRRKNQLSVVEVGQGSSRAQESVQAELRAAFVADQARGDASDDDETEPPSPGDLVQETPVSSNGRAEDVVQETPSDSNVRKKRGVTLMQRVWSLPPNMKVQLEVNVKGQPIGDSGQTFKRWLGTICLNPILCPLVPVAWTRFPDKEKEACWIEIENWALHLLGELRRNRRSKLKKKCYPKDALKEDVIQAKPYNIDRLQYEALVDYWFSSATKTLIDTNIKSRGFQKDIARSGPISFAQTADKMAKECAHAVERAVVFAKVYSTKDGQPISTEVGDKITLRDELAQSKQTHQEQIAEMQAKHKEEIAEIREQNKQQIDEALAEAKRQSDAQHKIQIDEMMAGVRSMFDSMRSFPNASQLPVTSEETTKAYRIELNSNAPAITLKARNTQP
ncbi:hypothetical protein CFP56_026965 [Quercus suber]|uniref:Uncharacterized protein n=1 Tax=Quercus suber TaxID=58331 RepID=A0AAW0K0T6_QUESU